MSDPNPLTARYLDVFANALGLDGEARPDGSVLVEIDHGLRVVARHFAPRRPELLRVSAAFESSRDRADLVQVFARVNPALKGAKFVSSPDGDGYVCATELIVAPLNEEPTVAHLKNVLPRALCMITYAVVTLAKEMAANDPGDGDAAA